MTKLTIQDGKYYNGQTEFTVTDDMIKFIPKEGSMIIFDNTDEETRFMQRLNDTVQSAVDNYIQNFI